MKEQPNTGTQSKLNDTTLSIRLTTELKELIIYCSLLDNITPSEFIRKAINKEIANKNIQTINNI